MSQERKPDFSNPGPTTHEGTRGTTLGERRVRISFNPGQNDRVMRD